MDIPTAALSACINSTPKQSGGPWEWEGAYDIPTEIAAPFALIVRLFTAVRSLLGAGRAVQPAYA